jgi:predicted transcriptional regulator
LQDLGRSVEDHYKKRAAAAIATTERSGATVPVAAPVYWAYGEDVVETPVELLEPGTMAKFPQAMRVVLWK